MSVDRAPEIIQPMAGQAAAHNSVGNTRDDELEEEGDETMLEGMAPPRHTQEEGGKVHNDHLPVLAQPPLDVQVAT